MRGLVTIGQSRTVMVTRTVVKKAFQTKRTSFLELLTISRRRHHGLGVAEKGAGGDVQQLMEGGRTNEASVL